MSDPSLFNSIIGEWTYLSVPAGVFIASIIGSTHCSAMCGPIAVTVHNGSGYLTLYHIGRLLSYLTLGLLAGLIGETFLKSAYPSITALAVVIMSVFFIFTGYKLISGKPLDYLPYGKIASLLSKPARWSFARSKPVKSLTLGVVNGFIPCGWVYIFVIGSIAVKNPLYSAFILFVFWLGTVPALSALPFIYKKTVGRSRGKLSTAAGIILIIVGVINLGVHFLPNHDEAQHNHSEHHMSNMNNDA